MKIKSWLVFCRTTRKLIEFVEMGDVNDAMCDFNRRYLSDDSSSNSEQEIYLAKYVSTLFYVMGHFYIREPHIDAYFLSK